jgi:hypothetical protein
VPILGAKIVISIVMITMMRTPKEERSTIAAWCSDAAVAEYG